MAANTHATGPTKTSFLSLAPDTRNTIYEMVYAYHKRTSQAITICSEKGYREIPSAISRTCRQIRSETLAYFFDLSLIIFVVRGPEDLQACRDWLRFTPEAAWKRVKGVRIRHAHTRASNGLACTFHFELEVDRAIQPVNCWWDRRPECGLCNGGLDGDDDCRPVIDMILKDMCAQGAVTASGVGLVFDMLEPWALDGAET